MKCLTSVRECWSVWHIMTVISIDVAQHDRLGPSHCSMPIRLKNEELWQFPCRMHELLQAHRTKHTLWLACAALQVFIWAPGSGLAFMLILCQGTSHIDGPSWFASVLQQIHVTVARLCTIIAFLQILSNSSFPSHATIDTIYSEIGQYPYIKYTILYTQFFFAMCLYYVCENSFDINQILISSLEMTNIIFRFSRKIPNLNTQYEILWKD